MSNSSKKPKYKRGDLVWRSGIGFGIILESYENRNKNWHDSQLHYTILWDKDAQERGGFQEWEITSMRYELENAS